MRKEQVIPQSVLDQMKSRFNQGQKFRVRHDFKEDGTPCSVTKDPAMVITRMSNGWSYYCHRCSITGFLEDTKQSPENTVKRVKEVIEKNNSSDYKTYMSCDMETVTIPVDCIDLLTQANVPMFALDWVYKCNLSDDIIKKYKFKWSDAMQRVIVPIYNPANGSLEGWVGRDVFHQTKEERQKKNVPKYTMRKLKKLPRLLFETPASVPGKVIFVEDVLSAIKVHEATGYKTVALLNTYMNPEIVRKYAPNNILYVWLDGDAKAKALAAVGTASQLGLRARFLYSNADPKNINEIGIKKKINER